MLPTQGSGADLPSAPFGPEVMEIDKGPMEESDGDLAIGPNPLPDWRVPYHDCLICEVLLMDKTEA